eukprot:m.270152 g.270152  ORF g.270152 m.270152 type:complete len:852 (-) comp88302_c0_seq1:53-2608(-)
MKALEEPLLKDERHHSVTHQNPVFGGQSQFADVDCDDQRITDRRNTAAWPESKEDDNDVESRSVFYQRIKLPFGFVATPRSIFNCFVLLPVFWMIVGVIADVVVYRHGWYVNAPTLLAIGYVASPFVLIFASWPREPRGNGRVASVFRYVWDICVSIVFLVMLLITISKLATSSRDAKFMMDATSAMVNGYQSVSTTQDVWSYLEGTFADNNFPPIANPIANTYYPFNLAQYFGVSPLINPLITSGGSISIRQIRVNPSRCDVNFGCQYGVFSDATHSKDCTSWKAAETLMGSVDYDSLSCVNRTRSEYEAETLQQLYEQLCGASNKSISEMTQLASNLQYANMEYCTNEQYCDIAFGNTSIYNDTVVYGEPRCPKNPVVCMMGSVCGILSPQQLNANDTIPDFWTTITKAAWMNWDGSFENGAHQTNVGIKTQGPTRSVDYPAGGFVWTVPIGSPGYQNAEFLKQLNYLKSNYWIDPGTRFIQITTIYLSETVSKWVVLNINFEIVSTGVVYSNKIASIGDYRTLQTELGREPEKLLGFYFRTFVFTVYFTATLVVRWFERKSFLRTVFDDMVCMDILVHLLIIGALVTDWASKVAFPIELGHTNNPFLGVSAKVDELARGWQMHRDLLGMVSILAWIRLMEYLALFPGVGTIPRAMIHAMKVILMFSVSLMLIMAGFVTGFLTIYSASEEDFQDVASTVLTLWSALIGNIDVTDFIGSNYYVGVVLFIGFSFSTLFVFLTMMMSLIGDAWDEAKDEAVACSAHIRKATATNQKDHLGNQTSTHRLLWATTTLTESFKFFKDVADNDGLSVEQITEVSPQTAPRSMDLRLRLNTAAARASMTSATSTTTT